jgi:hypothetical protein
MQGVSCRRTRSTWCAGCFRFSSAAVEKPFEIQAFRSSRRKSELRRFETSQAGEIRSSLADFKIAGLPAKSEEQTSLAFAERQMWM